MALVARRYVALLTATVVLGTIGWRRTLSYSNDRLYEERPPAEVLARNPFRFEEVATRLGLDYRHELYYPNPRAGDYLPLMAFPPAIAVADFDADGFMDIYVVQPKPGLPNRLFRNISGERFEDVAARVGLDDTEKSDGDSMALWADFDRDGHLDLFQSRFGCHTLFLWSEAAHRFVERGELLGGYCSNPKGVNVADINRDGWLDLLIGNYYPADDLAGYLPLNHIFGAAGANYQGGRSELLLGSDEGFHRADAQFDALRSHSAHTTTVGVSDINDDGWPDLFLGNDYTFDSMFENVHGDALVDVTAKTIPRGEHTFSGMNSDFADFDNEGHMGFYVSNMYAPPFVTTTNILWKHAGDHFENVARARGVGRCGWSWTAKFADFNNSGYLSLFVTNGKARGSAIKERPALSRSFFFIRNTIATVPQDLRYSLALYPNFSRFEMNGFDRNCLFWNDRGVFHDVAEEAGVADRSVGQSAALIDYDNDGKMDIAVGNMDGPLLLYHNVSASTGHWVGLHLIGPAGMTTPFGAKLYLHHPDGSRPMRELYPANGFRGQGDPRVHYGLSELERVPDVEVIWPDGRAEIFSGLAVDGYHDLHWGAGRAR